MEQSLAEIARALNIGKSSVQNQIRRIFLCGGPRPEAGKPPASLRGHLIALLENRDRSLPHHIVLAEDAVNWFHSLSSSRFSNLVDLEVQIAALSTLILLIVESPGSMTELGAFSFVDSLRRKLHAVLEGSYQEDRSFIMDGPIAKIRSECEAEPDSSRFYTCDWLSRVNGSPVIDVERAKIAARRLVDDILQPALDCPTPTERFDRKSIGHQMLLISDLVSLGGAIRLPEIVELLSGFGLKMKRKQLDQCLFLLHNLRFFGKTHDGRDDYYVQPNSSLKFVFYLRSDGKRFSRERFQSDIQGAFRQRPNSENRRCVLDAAKKKVQQ
jgi:hypothetical protein